MAGSIEQRGKRSWSVRLYVGWDPVARRRIYVRRTVRGSRRDAERLLREMVAARDRGELAEDVRPGRMRLAEYLALWLERHAATRAPSTAQRYRELLELHVVPYLGEMRLLMLRPLHIEQLYSALRDKGLAPKTVLNVHRVLGQALSHAVRLRLIGSNPAAAVTAPRAPAYRPRTLSPPEARRLLEAAAGTSWADLIAFALGTGMREGEIIGLRWEDVDLEAGAVMVRRSLRRVGKEWLERPPKAKSERRVVLPASLLEMLRRRRAQMGPQVPEDMPVFPGPEGGPTNPRTLHDAFRRLCKGAGIEGLRFHDLRHTSATWLLSQGVHPKVVSERMGHRTAVMTLDVYSHVLPDIQGAAAVAMDRVLDEVMGQRGGEGGEVDGEARAAP